VKHLRESFLSSVLAWNKIHRIIGREGDFASRIKESEQALKGLIASQSNTLHLVDIGAGSGLLGFPWLWLRDSSKLVLVEPDMKKAAFLLSFVAQEGLATRVLVLSSPFELVSRETIDVFAPAPRVFVARAFAGSKSYLQVIQESRFASEKFFTFDLEPQAKGSKAVLKEVSIS
jgi:16S rRNA G527 N7-methylase RsmG